MRILSDALAPWHDFYTLLGEASATMIGLLFVAASVGGSVFSQSRPGPLRMFLSASVVGFASILAGCLLVLAPVPAWAVFGGAILAGGVFGLGYSAMAYRGTVRDGQSKRIDLEDKVWYALAPAFGYLLEACAGVALILRSSVGCVALAVAMGTMMVVAIHNAWDITVWSVTRRRE